MDLITLGRNMGKKFHKTIQMPDLLDCNILDPRIYRFILYDKRKIYEWLVSRDFEMFGNS